MFRHLIACDVVPSLQTNWLISFITFAQKAGYTVALPVSVGQGTMCIVPGNCHLRTS
jgi:hypothetical protein